MGCGSSKNEDKIPQEAHQIQEELGAAYAKPTKEMSSQKDEYKSRLERKLCIAKETPEPEFDLSDCNLKTVPPGVFIHCKVLRKEILNLNKNCLQTLTCSANSNLSDLTLLRILNLGQNKIKSLPNEISKLENLRELLISHNQLMQLPETIKSLKYLELLDVSYNNLQSINQVNCMPSIKILNLSGNQKVQRLPVTLATCDSLCDLIVDQDNIEWPPQNVLELGTYGILKFLSTGEIDEANSFSKQLQLENVDKPEDALIKNLLNHKDKDSQGVPTMWTKNQFNYDKIDIDDSGYGNEDTLLREIQRQQLQKQQLLKTVLEQQNETESLVNKLQLQKDNNRSKLIQDIMNAEDNATLTIDKFLAVKTLEDNALLEKERLEEERLLEKLHLEHSDLRKQEILSTMSEFLAEEQFRIESYNANRNAISWDILEKETETTAQLGEFYNNYQSNRSKVVEKICEDEELQKHAVAALISRNDARSWCLVEQMKLVEIQLAGMTKLELERKKYSTNEQINELAEKRMNLTAILMSLLDQQEKRKMELLQTLSSMEEQKSTEQEDYWLLQYQRLLDSRPLEFSQKASTINPDLGYNFLVNGVIHCLPFLQKLLQNPDILIENISDGDLRNAGIRNPNDRQQILASIEDFLNREHISTPSAPKEPAEVVVNKMEEEVKEEGSGDLSECVICMEESVRVIFIPCGHMCCCLNCQLKVDICPMCRAIIERKIKVVQP